MQRWRSRVLGWRSGCQGNPRVHCKNPHQSDARNEGTSSHPACRHARQMQSGRACLCCPSSGSFQHLPLPLSAIWSDWGDPVTPHSSPLTGILSFSIFSRSRELNPFTEPNLTPPASPVPSLAAGRFFISLPALGSGLEPLCRAVRCGLLDEPRSSPGGHRAMAGTLRASFARGSWAPRSGVE